MTHILTQTAKILCGNSGENDAKQYLEPERKGRNSAQKARMDTRAVAHNPEVAGLTPVSATIKTPYFKRNTVFIFALSGSAGGPKELIARGKVDKKKPPS